MAISDEMMKQIHARPEQMMGVPPVPMPGSMGPSQTATIRPAVKDPTATIVNLSGDLAEAAMHVERLRAEKAAVSAALKDAEDRFFRLSEEIRSAANQINGGPSEAPSAY